MENLQLIRKRFDAARKIYGASDELITASGIKVKGRYVLCESGAVTPSHDPFDGFRAVSGFPVDSNGNTVNDRDYERDTDAQKITRDIAEKYDNRALQTPVIVSDGIVLSGNGRTMAGMLAAKNGTDGSYITYLTSHAEKYGFKSTEIGTFSHPRCVFETADKFTLNAETFAMFNAQEIKSQSKTEQAVKLGKLVDTDTFNRIIRNINTFDTIAEFYNDTKASTEAISDLLKAGIISRMQYPEMFDGDTISQTAREILENVLIGKAFSSSPDSVRQITAFKGVRRNIITALAEISNNISLGDYSLSDELSQAIALCYQARANGCLRQGDIVSGFARQVSMFDGSTVADFRNKTVMLLADTVNHSQITRLKKMYAVYNHQAQDAASGQTDMFSCGQTKSKQEILDDVHALFSTKKDLSEALDAAADARRQSAADAIWNERLKATDFNRDFSDTSSNGVPVGSLADLHLPSGETVTVRLELLQDGIAYIKMKGLYRCKVSEELLTPTSETCLSLPDWLSVGVYVKSSLYIKGVRKDSVTLSDGISYPLIDILLIRSASMRLAA